MEGYLDGKGLAVAVVWGREGALRGRGISGGLAADPLFLAELLHNELLQLRHELGKLAHHAAK